MDITKQSVEQLKALGYDLMAQAQQTQTNLQAINQELKNREEEPEKKTK